MAEQNSVTTELTSKRIKAWMLFNWVAGLIGAWWVIVYFGDRHHGELAALGFFIWVLALISNLCAHAVRWWQHG